jgi:hypothetical protein
MPGGMTRPSGMPSGGFTRPSGMPSGGFTRPSGLPGGMTRPTGMPAGFTRPSGLPAGFTRPSGRPAGGFSLPPKPKIDFQCPKECMTCQKLKNPLEKPCKAVDDFGDSKAEFERTLTAKQKDIFQEIKDLGSKFDSPIPICPTSKCSNYFWVKSLNKIYTIFLFYYHYFFRNMANTSLTREQKNIKQLQVALILIRICVHFSCKQRLKQTWNPVRVVAWCDTSKSMEA